VKRPWSCCETAWASRNRRSNARLSKIAVDPVWYLPGIAERFGCSEGELRRTLFEQTGGMFPELVTRHDLKVFLPPIGGQTVYLFGDLAALADPACKVACRVHDECNGSDVFGSDVCTCRPYLVHGIEVCIRTALVGGAGLIVYNRKDGRGLGVVTKFLVYNARKRQQGGDRAAAYFERTECVAGVQDVRFQELMPDVLHWLGITRIDRLVFSHAFAEETVRYFDERDAVRREEATARLTRTLENQETQIRELDARLAGNIEGTAEFELVRAEHDFTTSPGCESGADEN
jgi:GTP cyclohydrolase II